MPAKKKKPSKAQLTKAHKATVKKIYLDGMMGEVLASSQGKQTKAVKTLLDECIKKAEKAARAHASAVLAREEWKTSLSELRAEAQK